MTGLENIISEIDTDASDAADQKIKEAEKKAEEILADARKDCERLQKDADEKEKAVENSRDERLQSSIDLIRRTELLKAKQELIHSTVEKAYQKVKNEDTAAYFALMEKLLRKYVQPQKGEAYFGRADLERMPDSFESTMHRIAEEKGGSLQLMKAGMDITDGFILTYGGIEENCTLAAIFEAKEDEMQDTVQKILFN